MPWTKIDDQFYDHPKIVAAGPLGVALFVCALSYCGRHLTDGFIQAAQVHRLIDIEHAQAVADQLVKVGLWDRVNGGYHVHDYLEYNPSAQQVKQERKAAALRKAEWRRKRAEEEKAVRRASSHSGSPEGTDTGSHSYPDPDPDPDPLPHEDSSSGVPEEGASPPTLPSGIPDPSSLNIKQINKLDLSKEQWRELGTAEAQGKNRKGVLNLVRRQTATHHPSIEVYRTIMGHGPRGGPEGTIGQKIQKAVGDDPADLNLWKQIVEAWWEYGWNEWNARDMLDCYARREIPKSSGARAKQDSQAKMDRNLETIRNWRPAA